MACHRLPTILEISPEDLGENEVLEPIVHPEAEDEGLPYFPDFMFSRTNFSFGGEGESSIEGLGKYVPKEIEECLMETQKKGCERDCIVLADKEILANYVVETSLRNTLKRKCEEELNKFECPQSIDSDMFKLKFSKKFLPLRKQTQLEDVLWYFKWPSNIEFTPDLGAEKILEFISIWHTTQNWKHCLEFIGQNRKEPKNMYYYQSRWSLPCQLYPIPNAIASLFFTITVHDDAPHHCPVNVSYFLEGSSLQIVPGRIIFREEWLLNVIRTKINFFRRIDF